MGLVAFALPACGGGTPAVAPTRLRETPVVTAPDLPAPTASLPLAATAAATATSTPLPARLLTICLGREPKSLFLYQASQASAQSVLAAVYDGPVDVRHYDLQPVILASAPALATGDITLEPVQVSAGDWMADAAGNLTNLAEGTLVRPPGCADTGCAQAYSGGQPVEMEQMVVRFRLLPGLLWSDGAPLTADDSVYSYEVAKALFPAGQYGPLDRTAAYQALDATTLEWRGVPGYRGPYVLANFFSPLPRHIWGLVPSDQLPTWEGASRLPLGWGPYVMDEWVAGDHITLHRNENYFRASEGLPHFDNLVFRFMADGKEALQALLVGECDLIDPNAASELDIPNLGQLQAEGRVVLTFQKDTAWEFAFFGSDSLDAQRPKFFAARPVRQAVAMCVDRQKIVDSLLLGQSEVLNTYWPAAHPLYNPESPQYTFDPKAAQELLQSAGWLDPDGDATTPRVARGVAGVEDGASFEFDYLVSGDAERQAAAEIVKDSLAECGIRVNVKIEEPAVYLAAGPDGPVFGRRFDMAQLALPMLLEPPCAFFSSAEIPGPFPAFAKGWGGFNASGYGNPQFDQACERARFSLPGQPEFAQAQAGVQQIFAEDLPALPLYTRFRIFVSRPQVCPLDSEGAFANAFWNLETFQVGPECATTSVK